MNITDEMLMAFADDELEGEARETVAAAVREDASIAERVARHRALRTQIQQSFAAQLDEPVPERLLMAARGAGRPADSSARASVTGLETARAASSARASVTDLETARSARAAATRPLPQGAVWRRRPVMAIAASLVLGLALGLWVPRHSGSVVTEDGVLVARGALASALSAQLGGERSSGVQIGVSFRSKSGDYCRTFSMKGAASPSGLACHRAAEWQIQVLQAREGSGEGTTQYRTAASDMPEAVLNAVQGQIDGDALDQQGEIAARQQGWSSKR